MNQSRFVETLVCFSGQFSSALGLENVNKMSRKLGSEEALEIYFNRASTAGGFRNKVAVHFFRSIFGCSSRKLLKFRDVATSDADVVHACGSQHTSTSHAAHTLLAFTSSCSNQGPWGTQYLTGTACSLSWPGRIGEKSRRRTGKHLKLHCQNKMFGSLSRSLAGGTSVRFPSTRWDVIHDFNIPLERTKNPQVSQLGISCSYSWYTFKIVVFFVARYLSWTNIL